MYTVKICKPIVVHVITKVTYSDSGRIVVSPEKILHPESTSHITMNERRGRNTLRITCERKCRFREDHRNGKVLSFMADYCDS